MKVELSYAWNLILPAFSLGTQYDGLVSTHCQTETNIRQRTSVIGDRWSLISFICHSGMKTSFKTKYMTSKYFQILIMMILVFFLHNSSTKTDFHLSINLCSFLSSPFLLSSSFLFFILLPLFRSFPFFLSLSFLQGLFHSFNV